MKYQTKKGAEAFFTSDEMKAEKAIMLAEDLENTGRVKEIVFIDHQDVTWTLKQIKKLMKKVQTEPHDITVYFDGGFDLETRRAGLGCAIYYTQDGKKYRIRKNARVDGLISNNEAEYASLHLALLELELLGVHHMPVTFIGDSKVVVHQLNDEWPCYEEELAKWMDRIEEKVEELGLTPTYKDVSRKLNSEADHLAAQALAGKEITSQREIE